MRRFLHGLHSMVGGPSNLTEQPPFHTDRWARKAARICKLSAWLPERWPESSSHESWDERRRRAFRALRNWRDLL